jgi:hypothetical protein
MLIEKKFNTYSHPKIGDKIFDGEKMIVKGIGVKLKKSKFYDEGYIVFDKNYFIAKDGKGNWINGKLTKKP